MKNSPTGFKGKDAIFDRQFESLTGFSPLSWQSRLFFEYFERGNLPAAVDIPTGLGKTAVMALWLIARARRTALPRRMVYVVDRRAVVDQATGFAESLRTNLDKPDAIDLKYALDLAQRSLPISTLRGQHVDNREWLEDPSLPAIIVGTVDMIGSRLLFEGYGVSRKMRPYHAGLLGADTLVVLDEAHLVPPFEKLLEAIGQGSDQFAAPVETDRKLVPSFNLLSLSATGREWAGKVFRLEDCDIKQDQTVEQRLGAKKRVTIIRMKDGELADSLAEQAWALADGGKSPIRCLVYCHQRETAEKTIDAIRSLAKEDRRLGRPEVQIDTELFVGARRVFEREGVAAKLKELGFIAGSAVSPTRPAFLIATSAGEVGVDLDADHMVCDLVAWERMVQRLGRVNRRGKGDAKIVIVLEPEPKPGKAVADALSKSEADRNEKDRKTIDAFEKDRKNSLAEIFARYRPFDEGLLRHEDGTIDASPGALRDLKERAASDEALHKLIEAAISPAPLRPALSRALVDAWSMTSLEEHTGRPEVGPWLRGWIDDDKPQTAVVWRRHLPVRAGDTRPTRKEIEGFFEAAPPHASELLETETCRVADWLVKRVTMLLPKHFKSVDSKKEAHSEMEKREESEESNDSTDDRMATLSYYETVAFVLSGAGDLRKTLYCCDIIDIDDKVAKEKRKALDKLLTGATLVVDARVGGLRDGLLSEDTDDIPQTADGSDGWPNILFRVRNGSSGDSRTTDPDWRERLRFDLERTEEGEPKRWLVIEKWRHDAATEEDRSAGQPQALDEHQSWAARKALTLAQHLGLEDSYGKVLAIAARLHDEGKKAERWQRAFNARRDGICYAKTTGPLNKALLGGYRHEFGSLPLAANDPEFKALPADMQDLVLHLIAAHHGYARPVISTENCEDAPPSALEDRAREVALRFARLQKRWGPWGLAWWEALLRAADQQASRDNDARNDASNKENM